MDEHTGFSPGPSVKDSLGGDTDESTKAFDTSSGSYTHQLPDLKAPRLLGTSPKPLLALAVPPYPLSEVKEFPLAMSVQKQSKL